jgi:hypothetical protein
MCSPQADLVTDKIDSVMTEWIEVWIPRHELSQRDRRMCQSNRVASVVGSKRVRIAGGRRAEAVAYGGIEVSTVHVPAIVDQQIISTDVQVLRQAGACICSLHIVRARTSRY